MNNTFVKKTLYDFITYSLSNLPISIALLDYLLLTPGFHGTSSTNSLLDTHENSTFPLEVTCNINHNKDNDNDDDDDSN